MTGRHGTLRADGDGLALRYERSYAATPDEVWSAFTKPESIRRWLFADAVLEPRVGGVFRLVWTEDGRAAGSVLEWEPPRLLEVEWTDADARSILRVEISPSEGGAALVLDHRAIATDSAAISMGAGWHAHLEALGEVLEGRDASSDGWRRRYEALRPRYGQMVSGR